jgi:hypothetical protein
MVIRLECSCVEEVVNGDENLELLILLLPYISKACAAAS